MIENPTAIPLHVLGTIVPREAETGLPPMRLPRCPEAERLQPPLPFTQVASEAVVAQLLAAMDSVRGELSARGLGFENLVYLRVFLADGDLVGAVVAALELLLQGARPAGEITVCPAEGLEPGLLVFLDAVAVEGRVEALEVEGLDALVRPFAPAVTGGGLLFTALVPAPPPTAAGGEVESDPRVEAIRPSLPPESAAEAFCRQQAGMTARLLRILDRAGLGPEQVFYHLAWLGVSMQALTGGSLSRNLGRLYGRHCYSCFPMPPQRWPLALTAGRLIAVTGEGPAVEADSGLHPMSASYVGMVRVGSLVFAAGEVPVDCEARRPLGSLGDLPTTLRPPLSDRPEPLPAVLPQALAVYDNLRRGLQALGVGPDQVLHQTIYGVDPGDRDAIDRAACRVFGAPPPLTSFAPVLGASPWPRTRLEIEVFAGLGRAAGRAWA